MNSLDLHAISTRLHYGERLRPVRDWFLLLLSALVLIIASIGWNAWIYFRVAHGEEIGTAPAMPSALDTNAIDAVEHVFSDRAAEEARYENTYQFVDPSK